MSPLGSAEHLFYCGYSQRILSFLKKNKKKQSGLFYITAPVTHRVYLSGSDSLFLSCVLFCVCHLPETENHFIPDFLRVRRHMVVFADV